MQNMKAYVLLLAVMFVSVPLGGEALAAQWAETLDVRGLVLVETGAGQDMELRPGMRLMAGDMVVTDFDGYARFRLSEGSVLDVFEDTRLAMNDVLEEEESSLSLSLFFGRISMEVDNMASRDMVIVPTMVIGIRGTSFSVGVTEDGASVVSVAEGTVRVAGDDGWSEDGLMVSSGSEAVSLEAGGELSERPSQLGELESWRDFRSERLRTLMQRLPGVVENAEVRLDPALDAMDRIAATVAEHSHALEGEIDKLRRGDSSVSGPDIRQHVMAVFQGLGRFRTVRSRVLGAYERIAYLDVVMSRMAGLEGKAAEATGEAIRRLVNRRAEVEARVAQAGEDLRSAVEPIRPVLRKAREEIREWRGNTPWQGNPLRTD